MKVKELKEKSTDELKSLLTDSYNRLKELKFKVATSQIKNVREIRKTRQVIARVLTLLSEKK